MNLLDAFKQYIRDAMPGGALNPEVTTQGVLDAAALGTAPVPIVGDAIGLAADVRRLAKNPEERTPLNFALAGLGALPFVPGGLAGVVKGGKIADALNIKHGDKLDAYLMEGDRLNLSKVVVPKEARGSGVGSAFMEDLVSAADKQGKTVTLTPSSDFGGNKARLEKFYKRFGFVPNKGRTKDYEISEAMYRLPVEQPVPSVLRAPQAQALETARKNAVTMLGLPPNNTAMDRAKALGFVDDTYHGTFARFDSFDMSKASQRSQYMPGVFTADRPELAENFGDYIMPLMQRKGVTVKDVVAARNAGLPKPKVDTIHDIAAGVRVTDNPLNLRSRFAAFDPARVNENDLLGRADLGMLGLLAGGSAGLAYARSDKDKKDKK